MSWWVNFRDAALKAVGLRKKVGSRVGSAVGHAIVAAHSAPARTAVRVTHPAPVTQPAPPPQPAVTRSKGGGMGLSTPMMMAVVGTVILLVYMKRG